jgi:glycosyltransferase involved in cell wall biosynthesis
MKISILTVAFNSATTIADTLRSVASQTHVDIEHIVVDGASTDATLDVVRAHGAHVARLVSEPDRGIFYAMNKALSIATGDVVGFLNSDDLLANDGVIAHIADSFVSSGVDAVYGDLVFVDPLETAKVVRYWQSKPYVRGACLSGWMPPHPTLYVRRELLANVNGFDTEFRLQSDFDLCLRLFEVKRMRSMYVPETFVRMRTGGATTGTWRNMVRGNLEAARACRKNGFDGGPAFIARKIFGRVPQFFARPAAR